MIYSQLLVHLMWRDNGLWTSHLGYPLDLGELTGHKLKKFFCNIFHLCCPQLDRKNIPFHPPLTMVLTLKTVGKGWSPYQDTCCGTRSAVAMVSPFYPRTYPWCFTNSPQRQKFPVCQLWSKTQNFFRKSHPCSHALLGWPNNTKLFFF